MLQSLWGLMFVLFVEAVVHKIFIYVQTVNIVSLNLRTDSQYYVYSTALYVRCNEVKSTENPQKWKFCKNENRSHKTKVHMAVQNCDIHMFVVNVRVLCCVPLPPQSSVLCSSSTSEFSAVFLFHLRVQCCVPLPPQSSVADYPSLTGQQGSQGCAGQVQNWNWYE